MIALRGIYLFVVALLTTSCATVPTPDHVLVHPIFRHIYTCSEHAAGELQGVGDALGSDCVVQKFDMIDGRLWTRAHTGNGFRNEDWYGFGVDVMSPCECEVTRLHINDVTNQPGILGKPPSSSITLKRADGVYLLLAHIDAPSVKVGDRVAIGERIAKVGNNGYSRHPHIHVAAWKDNTPLQVRFDLNALGKLKRIE